MGSGEVFTLKDYIPVTKILRVVESRTLRWVCLVGRLEEDGNALNILTGKPEGKMLLEGPRGRWEVNIRGDLKEIGVNTRNLIQFRLCLLKISCNASFNLRVP